MNFSRLLLAVVAVLYLSLAVSVLGRPQPRSTPLLPQKSSSIQIHFPEAPFTQERRILKRSSGGGSRSRPVSGGGGSRSRPVSGGGGSRSRPVSGGGGGGTHDSFLATPSNVHIPHILPGGGGRGGGSLSRKVIIIISCTIAGAIVLLAALLLICYNLKKTKHPNWRFVDVFKRKNPAAEKLSVDSEEHKMAPRLDHTAKPRKQVSLSHELK